MPAKRCCYNCWTLLRMNNIANIYYKPPSDLWKILRLIAHYLLLGRTETSLNITELSEQFCPLLTWIISIPPAQ